MKQYAIPIIMQLHLPRFSSFSIGSELPWIQWLFRFDFQHQRFLGADIAAAAALLPFIRIRSSYSFARCIARVTGWTATNSLPISTIYRNIAAIDLATQCERDSIKACQPITIKPKIQQTRVWLIRDI